MDNPDLSDEVLEYMIQQVDTNNDGKVNFEEFIKMMDIWKEDGKVLGGAGKNELLQDKNNLSIEQMINMQTSGEQLDRRMQVEE